MDLHEIPAALLVGGMGTRLRSVLPSTPKTLALVAERPFLELIFRQLVLQGVQNVILCTGHLADQVEACFGDGHQFGLRIQYSREFEPLGTSGAIKLAHKYLENAPEFLVLNGDSFVQFDLRRFLRLHREKGGVATLAAIEVEDASRYGTICLGDDNQVLSFHEKSEFRNAGLVNAGAYIFNSRIFQRLPNVVPASLERDVFPELIHHGLFAFVTSGPFIDIGTPEDYRKAQAISQDLYKAAIHRT